MVRSDRDDLCRFGSRAGFVECRGELLDRADRIGRHLAARLYGDLAAIMAYAEGERLRANAGIPGWVQPGMRFSVVAGAGFEPATFRL